MTSNGTYGLYITQSKNIIVNKNISKNDGRGGMCVVNESTGSYAGNTFTGKGIHVYDKTKFVEK